MSKQLKANLLHALFVGIICGVLIGVYAALPIETPLYWAAFIMIPTVFMFGGEWKDVPYHWVNAAIGLPLAFAVATCICTFLVQGLTNGVFSPGGFKLFFGRCPMAFVGMITCFAAGGQNYVVALVSLMVGIVFATLSAQSGKLAARIVGLGQDGQSAEAQAEGARA